MDNKGHSIFRNQPNHSYFDKPFDEQDSMFLDLHEIDSHFLKPEQKAVSINLMNAIITDPRTNKPITKMCYDYTKSEVIEMFHFHKKSFMSVSNHELGVRVLHLLQQCLEVEEEDMYNWYRLQKLKQKENQYFQKFVFEFSQSNKEKMYTPCRKFLRLYQKWYNSKAARLMNRYPQETYNTHLGMPHVRLCKNVLIDYQVKISNQENVNTVGEQCCWHENIQEDLNKLNFTISSYAEVFKNSEEIKETLEINLKQQFEQIVEREPPECPIFYIPLESLLFLLTAGDYIDMPTEMLLDIKETVNLDSDFKKYVIMEPPLPPRQCGWHTYEEVLEQAITAILSIKQTRFPHNNVHTNISSNQSLYFKVSTFEDFMEKSKAKADKLCKFSKTLTKWQLAAIEHDMKLQLYTSLELFGENKSIAFKLEHKPRFGCETLTKYKLIKEWLKLKLVESSESRCLRLDVTNYKTLVEEPLNTRKLEEYLYTVYNLKCSQMLNNLYEFLKMLYDMPLDHYMLRYNPKFKDKLMLCKPSQEITQNTIHLHQMLSTDVSDLEFMSQQIYVPIDENVCSLMHLQHKIMPAAFSPLEKDLKIKYMQPFSLKKKNVVVQPRKKFKTYSKSKKPVERKKSVKNKKKNRANRKKREYAAFKAKKDELIEMQEEMQLDRLMLNNL